MKVLIPPFARIPSSGAVKWQLNTQMSDELYHFLYLIQHKQAMSSELSFSVFFRYSVIVVVSVILLVEIFLRVTGKYQVFSEMNGQRFYSEYGQVNNSWFHTRHFNDTFVPAGVDFHYQYITNRYGFRDKNYDTVKSPAVFRILVSGDSFAEGEGSPYDSTWPRIMEKYLIDHGIHAEVNDAGVAGSDILYDYVHYREKLKELHPDLVIASLNSSDYYDYLTRGGMERFHKDGTTHLRPAPWYMFFFKHSRFVRALLHKICGYQSIGFFVSYKEYKEACDSTNAAFADIFNRYKTEAGKNNANFVAMVHTTPTEVKFPEIDIIKTSTQGLNSLANMLSAKGITCFNISAPLFNKLSPMPMDQISYPHDLHYTPIAYTYMGKIMADSLLAKGVVKP